MKIEIVDKSLELTNETQAEYAQLMALSSQDNGKCDSEFYRTFNENWTEVTVSYIP